jgi:gamma-glutamylcyclotransferase (GGCT)/AIG2-like uncharacterized protein YtfP
MLQADMSAAGEDRELVFIYGTLRRGGPNHGGMAGAEFVAEGLSRGSLYEVSRCPCFVPAEEGSFIAGDLYQVRSGHLEELGDLEVVAAGLGEAGMVEKIRVKVHPNNLGQQAWDAWAWAWVRPVTTGARIPSGDWLEWVRSKPQPWFTLIALLCLAGLPLALAAPVLSTYYARPGLLDTGIAVLGVFSPPVGLYAAWMASRRWERWGTLRRILFPLLGMASAPAVLAIIGLVIEAIRTFLR